MILLPIYIYTQMKICTVSLNFTEIKNFHYAEDLIPLTVSEYDNETTKTAGIPGCKTGKILFGYGDKQPVGGFELDESNNYIEYK